MDTNLIYDVVENIYNKEILKLVWIEDYIETHPDKPEEVTCTYFLYEATYTDQSKQKFVIIDSNSARIAIPAKIELLREIFPDHAPKDTNEQAADGGTPVQPGDPVSPSQ